MILNMMSLHRKLISKAALIGVRNLHASRALRKNLYETLGLTRDATQADIKNAYFELSKIFHPDKIAATDENLAKFREISQAYEILVANEIVQENVLLRQSLVNEEIYDLTSNEQSRKLYDRGLVGDFKRPGLDDTQEIVDPIIKFYKQRQEAPRPKAGEGLEAWTAEYYRQAKERSAKKAQFYTVSRRQPVENDNPYEDIFMLCLFMGIGFLFYTNYRGTNAEKLWKSWFSTDRKLQ